MSRVAVWMGVDVGGSRKRFDVAVIDDASLVDLRARLSCRAVVELAAEIAPLVIAVDSPRNCAPAGERSRECEREVAKHVCRIRWTPHATAVGSNDYYAWIVEGLKLYAALESDDARVIEVFPTASWTRWCGRRGSQRRSAWTRQGLAGLDLRDLPKRTNQDQRDAIAAAVTGRQYTEGMTESFGDIVVPITAT